MTKHSPLPSIALGAALVLSGLACAKLLGPGLSAGPDARAAAPGAASPVAPRIIAVDGQARLEVPPDRVDLSLVLTSRKPTPREAAKDVRRRQARLVKALDGMGVRGDDLVIAGLSLNPVYRSYPATGIEAYAANVTLVASVHDFDKVADVMEAAATADVERIYTSYHHTKLHELKAKARSMALKAARKKAAQMATELGVTLGALQAVEERNGGSRGQYWWNPGVDNEVNTVSRVGRGVAAAGQAQLIHLRLTINARFAIL